MNKELLILNGIFKSRSIYEKVIHILSKEDFSPQGKCLYEGIKEFYTNDMEATQVDPVCFKLYLERVYANKAKDLVDIIDYKQELISEANLLNEIIEYKHTTAALKLAATLNKSNTTSKAKRQAVDEYQEFVSNLSLEATEEDSTPYSTYNGVHIEEFTKAYKTENLIQIFPGALNTLLNGGVPIHTHIGIIGVQNSGKTLLAIANACGNIRKGRNVVYCGNEEGAEAFMMRITSRMLEKTKEEIQGKEDIYMEELISKGYNNLTYVDMSPGTPDQVEEVINKWEPSLVVVDQVRQLHVGTKISDGSTAQLTQAAKEMRRLCKKYPIVLMSITQAGESAKNKLNLEQDDCYMSNTTFSGDCDIMFGWGMDENYENTMRRRVNLPRDKVHGKNHKYVDVTIDPFRSKIIS